MGMTLVSEELVRELRERNEQLEHALLSRIVIEQAKGVLAERLGLDVEEAFEVLRGSARSARIRIHDLAATIVADPMTPRPVADWLAQRGGRVGSHPHRAS
jgi:AmiR/NasT family two-component response regulator